jgi:hypothetical protein
MYSERKAEKSVVARVGIGGPVGVDVDGRGSATLVTVADGRRSGLRRPPGEAGGVVMLDGPTAGVVGGTSQSDGGGCCCCRAGSSVWMMRSLKGAQK